MELVPFRKGSAVTDEFKFLAGSNVLKYCSMEDSLGCVKVLAVCAAVKGLSLAYVVLK